MTWRAERYDGAALRPASVASGVSCVCPVTQHRREGDKTEVCVRVCEDVDKKRLIAGLISTKETMIGKSAHTHVQRPSIHCRFDSTRVFVKLCDVSSFSSPLLSLASYTILAE